jgi:hypothetical protein
MARGNGIPRADKKRMTVKAVFPHWHRDVLFFETKRGSALLLISTIRNMDR